MPETWAVTAYFRIAPTAISSIDVPMVMSASIPGGPVAQPSATTGADDGSIFRDGHGRGPARSRPPRSDLRGPPRADSGAHLNPASDATDSEGGFAYERTHTHANPGTSPFRAADRGGRRAGRARRGQPD